MTADAAQTGITVNRPAMTADTSFFWELLAEGSLGFQQCSACDLVRHPPLPSCSRCHSFDWHVLKSPGLGCVFSYTVVHRGVPSPYQPGLVVVLVELDEGVRLLAPYVGDTRGDDLMGQRVRVGFRRVLDDLTLPEFTAAAAGDGDSHVA